MAGKERQKKIFSGDVDIIGALAASGAVTNTGVVTDLKKQDTATALIATADGLTTGLIPTGTKFAALTCDTATKIFTLPDGSAGGTIQQEIWAWIGATGCELRTVAGSNATINNVDSSGAGQNEAAIPATTLLCAKLVAADTWVLLAWDELAAAVVIVPDAV